MQGTHNVGKGMLEDGKTYRIGRDASNDLVLDHPTVAPFHALLLPMGEEHRSRRYVLRDLETRTGTFVNRMRVDTALITLTDVVELGRSTLALRELEGLERHEPTEPLTGFASVSGARTIPLDPRASVTVGSDPKCDVALTSPQVPWRLGELVSGAGGWTLRTRTEPGSIQLRPDVPLHIFGFGLTLRSDSTLTVEPDRDTRLDVVDLGLSIGSKRLLHSINFTACSGELVGVMGPSGSGKTMLLKCLCGVLRPTAGRIQFGRAAASSGGSPVQLADVGYVPQDDIVLDGLTIREQLRYAARLRLNRDWPDAALDELVDRVVSGLFLADCQNRPARVLSGGQRKRLTLATELLTAPRFLLADEPCSGLSAWDSGNVLHHLRRLTEEGMTVLLTIHSPDIEALKAMDMLLLIDGGHIAYYGPSYPDAIEYFSRRAYSPYQSPKLILDVLEKRDGKGNRITGPSDWGLMYREGPLWQKYVKKRRIEDVGAEHDASAKPPRRQSLPWLRKVAVLVRRGLLELTRDRSEVLVSLGQAPLMAMAFYAVFWAFGDQQVRILRASDAPHIVLFLAVLAAVWFGTARGIDEVPRHWARYRQERRSFLTASTFLASRIATISIALAAQVTLFTVTLLACFQIVPAYFLEAGKPAPPAVDTFLLIGHLSFTLWLSALASAAIAILVSAHCGSVQAARSALPFLLVLQILLSGGVRELLFLPAPIRYAAMLSSARWGKEAATMAAEYHLAYKVDAFKCSKVDICHHSSIGGSFLSAGDRASAGVAKSDIAALPEATLRRYYAALPASFGSRGDSPAGYDEMVESVGEAARCAEAQASYKFVSNGCDAHRVESFWSPIDQALMPLWNELRRDKPDIELYRGRSGTYANLVMIVQVLGALALTGFSIAWREREDQRPA